MLTDYYDPTPGDWRYVPGEPPFSGNMHEPPEPGYPPTIVSALDGRAIVLAEVKEPVPEDPAYDPESGETEYIGNIDVNGNLMAAAQRLRDQLDNLVMTIARETICTPGLADTRAEMERADFLLQSLKPRRPRPRRDIRDLRTQGDDG